MELLKPFAVNGEREDFSVDTDPDGKVSLDRGFTQLYEMKPTEGGKFIERKTFNQMMYLVSKDTVDWKTQTYANWNSGLTYPKNAIVRYTNGNVYVSKVANNTTVPTNTTNWLLFNPSNGYVELTGNQTIEGVKTFSQIPFVPSVAPNSNYQVANKKYVDDSNNISSLPDKPTPVDTDNLKIQETSGLFKKLTWANLKATLFDGAISTGNNGYIKFPTAMGGLMIQWGSGTIDATGELTVIFPIAFNTVVRQFVANATGSSVAQRSVSIDNGNSATSIRVYGYTTGSTVGFRWIAVGY